MECVNSPQNVACWESGAGAALRCLWIFLDGEKDEKVQGAKAKHNLQRWPVCKISRQLCCMHMEDYSYLLWSAKQIIVTPLMQCGKTKIYSSRHFLLTQKSLLAFRICGHLTSLKAKESPVKILQAAPNPDEHQGAPHPHSRCRRAGLSLALLPAVEKVLYANVIVKS